jgi:hypothetical protein
MLNVYSLSGATIVTPEEVLPARSIKIARRRIERIGTQAKVDFDARGLYLYPALINIHDHLRGDYLPRIGPEPGDYYLNWSCWEKHLRSSSVMEERGAIPVQDIYFLGAYKNLFSGVGTVNDHFPHEFNEPFLPELPIRVIPEYTLAHECSSFDLKWGDGIEVEYGRAVERDHPFITHLEEGFDDETQRGIEILERLKCLDSHDVLVHCIGFSDEDIRKAREAGVSVAWCPASNLFMFNLTCKIRKLLQAGVNVCLGTDSTHTGSVNLLEEMRFARKVYRKMYGEDLDARQIVRMVTVNPARAFRRQADLGSIEEEKLADLLLLKPRVENPCEALVEARMEDIELLVQEGTPIYGSARYAGLFQAKKVRASRIRVGGREMLVLGDPAGLLQRVREKVGFRKVLDYLPMDE